MIAMVASCKSRLKKAFWVSESSNSITITALFIPLVMAGPQMDSVRVVLEWRY